MTRPLRSASFTFQDVEYTVTYRSDGPGSIEDVDVFLETSEGPFAMPLDAGRDEAAVAAAFKDLESEQDSARYDYEETEER